MSCWILSATFVVALVIPAISAQGILACPFCSAVSQTMSEEIGTMDAVVVARLARVSSPQAGGSAGSEIPKAVFEITDVVKGKSHLGSTKTIEAIYFGTANMGDKFLIMGVDPPRIAWSTPLKVSDRAVEYLCSLEGLPEKGAGRLKFFQNYLEDEDELLSQDAYDEFARAPYKEVTDLKKEMDHDRIVALIKNPDIPASRRRLYFVMLSVCGGPDDLPMLEEMLKSEDRKVKEGLDATVGCYLLLTRADGMPLVEDLFLKNRKAEYVDTYATIMALRFHGTEVDVIERQRILAALHHVLDRPQLAYLVIPDLARWEDWSQMKRLVKMFKEVDEKSNWVRVPVVNYLRACPKPEAKRYIEELKKIDPDAVKRANTFFPFGGAASPGGDSTSRAAPRHRTSFTVAA
jgi:hypothetical protein